MRRLLLAVAGLALIVWASPVYAQSSTSGGAGGGSASSGSSKSSVHIRTSGGSSVGVAQGSVAGGSSASGTNNGGEGDQQGSASSGGAGSGQVAAVVPATAVEDGVVNQVDVPALDLSETQTAADERPDVLTWAIAGAIVLGLIVLYRRLPRATTAG